MLLIVAVAATLRLATAAASGLAMEPLASRNGQQHLRIANQIVLPPVLNHSLLVCNGYAFKEPLSVIDVQTASELTHSPIPYKSCQSIVHPLQNGDRLDFKTNRMSVGTFEASGLPRQAASLLLIPCRRSANSLAASFQSHVFSELQNAQVAVIDAYRGASHAVVEIMDSPLEAPKAEGQETPAEPRVEELRYNNIVALSPGNYKIGLAGQEAQNANAAFTQLKVLDGAKYVVMRVGADDGHKDGPSRSYPQELIVFTQSLGLPLRPGLLYFLLAALAVVV